MRFFVALLALGFTMFCHGEESDLEKANKAFEKRVNSCGSFPNLPSKNTQYQYGQRIYDKDHIDNATVVQKKAFDVYQENNSYIPRK